MMKYGAKECWTKREFVFQWLPGESGFVREPANCLLFLKAGKS